ncbi:MAG: DUF4136 domain-containing protein [Mangrovibacterium sp.]
MRTLIKTAFPLMIALLIASAATAQVNSDFNKTYDFSKVKTYKFIGWNKNSNETISPTDVKSIQRAFKNELDTRDLKQVESNADVEISLFAVVNEKESKDAYTDFTGAYGYPPMGWGWGWRCGIWARPLGVTADTNIDTEFYKEGTLVIDFFDTKTKDLIYEGLFESQINDNAAKRAEKTPKKVAKIMKKFPVKKVK